jgi:hypothetical protein
MDHELPRHAVRAVAASQWAYWCSLAGAALSVQYIPAGSLRLAVMLAPVLTAALCVSLTFWLYESCDEYLRSSILKSVARTAVIVAACPLVYFVLELAGFARVSMLWVNLLGWSVCNLQMLFVILRSR